MKPKGTRRFRKKPGLSIYLEDREHSILEQRAAQENTSVSSYVAGLVREAVISEGRDSKDRLADTLDQIISRLTKLERIQRTLVLNTAYARGHAIGVLRSTPAETRKTIEQEMSKNFAEQKDFFFSLYPDQLEGDRKEERS